MDIAMMGLLSTLALFVGMLAFTEFGRSIGRARLARDPAGLEQGFGAAESALFALLGLLVAFTFSGAASRFEVRKHLIVQEANAIGTAFLRIDLLPADAQPAMRTLFKQYLDTRLLTYAHVDEPVATMASLAEGNRLQGEIWAQSLAAARRPDAVPQAAMLLLPALNEMIDITTVRTMASKNHPPPIVFLLLCILSLIAAMMVGYDTSPNATRGWFHRVIFCAMVSMTVYVIVDIEVPRLGLIRVDATDEVLMELRRSMD